MPKVSKFSDKSRCTGDDCFRNVTIKLSMNHRMIYLRCGLVPLTEISTVGPRLWSSWCNLHGPIRDLLIRNRCWVPEKTWRWGDWGHGQCMSQTKSPKISRFFTCRCHNCLCHRCFTTPQATRVSLMFSHFSAPVGSIDIAFWAKASGSTGKNFPPTSYPCSWKTMLRGQVLGKEIPSIHVPLLWIGNMLKLKKHYVAQLSQIYVWCMTAWPSLSISI